MRRKTGAITVCLWLNRYYGRIDTRFLTVAVLLRASTAAGHARNGAFGAWQQRVWCSYSRCRALLGMEAFGACVEAVLPQTDTYCQYSARVTRRCDVPKYKRSAFQ